MNQTHGHIPEEPPVASRPPPGPDSRSDVLETLAAAARQSGQADALLHAMRPLVYRWALVRTGNADEAEDVAQTVLLRVHRGLGAFHGRSRFTTWLYRVTANTLIEQRRRRGLLQRLRERWGGLAATVTPADDALAVIEHADTRELVRVLLHQLPAGQRAAFDLVDLQGHSPALAATMLGLKPSTLRVNLLRARRALRQRMLAGSEQKGETKDV